MFFMEILQDMGPLIKKGSKARLIYSLCYMRLKKGNRGGVNCVRRLNQEDEHRFNETYLRVQFFHSQRVALDGQHVTLLLVEGGSFHGGVSSPALKKKKEGQSVFLLFAVFHVAFTQDRPKWHILGLCALNSSRSFCHKILSIETYLGGLKDRHFEPGELMLHSHSAYCP